MAAALHSTEAEIEHLDQLCQRLAGFNDEISLEWVDGFMTALVAGPRAVAPSEWLTAMFDDAFERAFADPQDVSQAMAAFLGRWNVIARQLDGEALIDDSDTLRLQPLMIDYGDEVKAGLLEDGTLSAEDIDDLPATGTLWAIGFLDAVEAFSADWTPPEPEGEMADLFRQCLDAVSALTFDPPELEAHLAAHYPGHTLSRDDLVDEAAYAVQDLRLFWIDNAPRPATRRVDPAPGRNDPCPCGSGRKYKKCHGAT